MGLACHEAPFTRAARPFPVAGRRAVRRVLLYGTGHGGVEQSKLIRLTIEDLSQMVLVFQSQWRRGPTPEELQQLVEDKVREEVLYREALTLGLDKDDTIVKRRMAQKMQFLAEDVAAAREPTREELGAWFEVNRDHFALPPRI